MKNNNDPLKSVFASNAYKNYLNNWRTFSYTKQHDPENKPLKRKHFAILFFELSVSFSR